MESKKDCSESWLKDWGLVRVKRASLEGSKSDDESIILIIKSQMRD